MSFASRQLKRLQDECETLRERLEFSEQTTTNVMSALADSGAETAAAEQRADAAEAQVERIRALADETPDWHVEVALGGSDYVDERIREALDGPQ